MHTTRVKTKNGDEYIGHMRKFRPEDNYFEIVTDDIQKFSFDEVLSVITKDERLSGGKIGDQDEIQRAREHLIQGRKYNWFGREVPVMEWENGN